MKRTRLQKLLTVISGLVSIPLSLEEAIEQDKKEFLHLEYTACYGGYRLVLVGVERHNHKGIFGGNGSEPRLSRKEMEAKLEGIIAGLQHKTD